ALEGVEEAQQISNRLDVLRPAIDRQGRLAPEDTEVSHEGRQPVRMIGMDVGDDDRGERLRLDAGAMELLDRAAAAVDQHGALGRDDDDRRRVADGGRNRARRAQKCEVHQGVRRRAGSKGASAGWLWMALERTVKSTRSLASTNTSWRYGK